MKKLVFIIAGLFYAAGASAAPNCEENALKRKSVHSFPGAGYWMQAAGDCRITYTSVGGISSSMYNLCTRQAETISNYIDAFGLPEGDLYVHPGMEFYKMSGAHKGNRNEPIFVDRQHGGNYQSIGTLPGSDEKTRNIRIAVGSRAGKIRDYRIEKTGGDDYKITALGDGPKSICGNIEGGTLDTEIPILSRDGQLIAGRDREGRKTKIFKIKMPSGDCDLVATVPTRTSKVNFAFDGKSIVYVGQDPDTRKNRVYQMHFAQGKEPQVDTLSGPDEDPQYVTTRKDGTVFYTRRKAGGGTELIELGPSQTGRVEKPKRFEALGLLWADACGKQIDYDQALAIGRRLEKSSCDAVVTPEGIAKLEAEYKDISIDALRASCEEADASVSSSTTGTR